MAYDTIALDRSTWDSFVDASGNIAMGAPPYAIAQDVASAIKLYLGEAYYNTSIGVPYYEIILGQSPPLAVFKAQMVAAAMTVPGVVSATCYVSSYTNRAITGQVQFTDSGGYTLAVRFPGTVLQPVSPSVVGIFDQSTFDGGTVFG